MHRRTAVSLITAYMLNCILSIACSFDAVEITPHYQLNPPLLRRPGAELKRGGRHLALLASTFVLVAYWVVVELLDDEDWLDCLDSWILG